jgi:hypothetical protein
MTNHPHRKRDDEPSIESPEPGDIPPQGSAEVPMHTGNGVPLGLQANAARLIGRAVAEAVSEMLPPMLAQALGSATPQYHCATCLAERLNWEIAHEADLRASVDEMRIAGQAMQPGDPRLAQLNPFMFLPPHLLPSQDPADPHPEAIPVPSAGVTMAGGTLFCAAHMPGVNRPGEVPKRPLLVATTAMGPVS